MSRKEKNKEKKKKKISWVWLPFVALWKLVAWIIGLVGRLITGCLGCCLMVVGLILTVTIIGAIIGVPLLLVGLWMLVRSVF